MNKKVLIQNAVVIVLGLAIISMSIGYAMNDTSFKVEGTATFESAIWSVHLENPVKTINSTVSTEQVVNPPIVNKNGTGVNFSVNMQQNDVYEFTIDVRNSGTLNAKLSNYTLVAHQNERNIPIENASTSSDDAILVYEIFDAEDEEALNIGEISTKTIRITAKNTVPNEILKYDFDFNMTYIQNN